MDTWRIRSRSITRLVKRRDEIIGLAILLLVAVISLALTLQGWRSRIPAFDLLTYIHGIRDLLATGAIPQHGDTGSYGSFKPPGTAWLMLPSAILFADPRLSEYVGTALLHVSTLVAVYLLARRYFGLWCACLAVPLYGLSSHGLFMAGSLWPNGRPDFYVWIALLTSQWVVSRKAKYLAAALAIWGVGMQVDMGITPAFFLIAAAWLYYKPPVRLEPLLVAAALVLVVWSPYLRFEASRGFLDVRSQLLQQNIFPGNYRDTWCDRNLALFTLVETSSGAQANAAQSGLDRLVSIGGKINDKAFSNYEPVAPVPGAGYALLLLTIGSLLILSVPGCPATRAGSIAPTRPAKLPLPEAIGLILSGALAGGFTLVAGSLGRDLALIEAVTPTAGKLGKILLLIGLALLIGPWLAATANRLIVRFGVHIQTGDRPRERRLLVFILLVPWLILLIVAEPGKPERYWWLWPLQSIFLAAFLTDVLPRFRLPRLAVLATQALVILVVAGNSFLLTRIDSWTRTGWAGQDAEEIQVVDFLARRIADEGKDRAAIGYSTFIYPFMASYNITNPVYKVGAEFDLLLLYRRKVANTNQCAEGVSPTDEYRIVETRPKPPDWSPRDYLLASTDGDFHLLTQVGSYHVYGRD